MTETFLNQQKIQDVQPTPKYTFVKLLGTEDKQEILFKAARDVKSASDKTKLYF